MSFGSHAFVAVIASVLAEMAPKPSQRMLLWLISLVEGFTAIALLVRAVA